MNQMEKRIFNRRVYSNAINFFAFLIIFAATSFITSEYKVPLILSLMVKVFVFVFYFGIIPKLTNGYTLGGYIIQMRLLTLDKSSIKILDLLKRVFDIFIFYWKTIYTHDVKINNFYQWKPDVKHNITLLPSNFNFENLDKKDNWQEVDYYFYYFPILFKNFFLVMFILMIIDNIFKYIIGLFK